MDLFTGALIAVIAILLFYYFRWGRMTYFKDLGIPHEQPIPILGNVAPLVFRQISMAEHLQRAYNLYPEHRYFGFYNFDTPVIVIRDPELITAIAVKHFDQFTDHRGFVDEELDPLMGKNLFSLRGDRWREMRKVLSPAFTSSKMRTMFTLMCDCAVNFADYIAMQSKRGKVHDLKDIFGRYTTDVIASCAFGISVDSMKNPNNEFYVFAKETVDFTSNLSIKFLMGKNFPTISKLFGIRLFGDKARRYFRGIVADTVRMREKSASSSNNGAGGINLGPVVGGRRPPSQQSFHSSKNSHSHHSRHQSTSAPPSTPRNASQQPEIAARCIHIRSSSRNIVSTRNQQSITKMLLLISSVFILLNLPSYVIRLCVFFFTLARKNTPDLLWCLQQFFMLLYYTNFSINFLLYAMCGITFRSCLQQLLRKVLKSMTRYHCNPQRYI